MRVHRCVYMGVCVMVGVHNEQCGYLSVCAQVCALGVGVHSWAVGGT